jgi:hypothetical protein
VEFSIKALSKVGCRLQRNICGYTEINRQQNLGGVKWEAVDCDVMISFIRILAGLKQP